MEGTRSGKFSIIYSRNVLISQKIATKVYPDKPGKHLPDVLTENFNTSLKELGTDCVDIFYLHAAVSLLRSLIS